MDAHHCFVERTRGCSEDQSIEPWVIWVGCVGDDGDAVELTPGSGLAHFSNRRTGFVSSRRLPVGCTPL